MEKRVFEVTRCSVSIPNKKIEPEQLSELRSHISKAIETFGISNSEIKFTYTEIEEIIN